MIDNDFHPIDRGLEATNDHWGTQLADITTMRRPANDNKNLNLGDGIDLDANWAAAKKSLGQKPNLKVVK